MQVCKLWYISQVCKVLHLIYTPGNPAYNGWCWSVTNAMDINNNNSTGVVKTRSAKGSAPSNSSVPSLISVNRPLPTEPHAHAGLHFHKDKTVSLTQKVCSFCSQINHSYISCDRNPINAARYCTCTTVMFPVCWWISSGSQHHQQGTCWYWESEQANVCQCLFLSHGHNQRYVIFPFLDMIWLAPI